MSTTAPAEANIDPPRMDNRPLLRVTNLQAGYGAVKVLFGIDIEVRRREVVALLGPNGAGKTTLLRTIIGRIQPSKGEVWLGNRRIDGLEPEEVVNAGVVHIAQGRNLFPTMTVEENLRLGAYRRQLSASKLRDELNRAYDLFPRLRERRTQLAGSLSGGEQQMLTLGRGMLTDPILMLVDEASLGLAPNLAELVFERLKLLTEEGVTVLLVEQYVRLALDIASRGYVLEQGHITLAGTDQELSEAGLIEASYLGGTA